jgi:hypothetical protein
MLIINTAMKNSNRGAIGSSQASATAVEGRSGVSYPPEIYPAAIDNLLRRFCVPEDSWPGER